MKIGEILTFKDIMDDDSLPPKPIIKDGILLDKTILAVIGPAKTKKTFLCMNFAKAIASGGSFAGFEASGTNKVMYLCAEGGYFPNRDRIKIIAKDLDEQMLESVIFPQYVNLTLNNPEDYSLVKDLISEHSPSVLIIDPFIRFHDVDENTSNCISGIFKLFRELIEMYSISIILVHHAGKDPSRGGRGSSVITGEYDSAIYLIKKTDCTKMVFDMRHVETPDSRYISFNSETLTFECTDSSSDPVFEYIENNGNVNQTELIKYWVQNDTYSQSHAYRMVKKSVSHGLVKSDDGYLYIEDTEGMNPLTDKEKEKEKQNNDK